MVSAESGGAVHVLPLVRQAIAVDLSDSFEMRFDLRGKDECEEALLALAREWVSTKDEKSKEDEQTEIAGCIAHKPRAASF